MRKIGFLILALLFLSITNCSKKSVEVNTPVIDKTLNLQGTGDSANDILSNDEYSGLLIEIAYVKDFRPRPNTIANLTEFLRERTFKQDIEVIYSELPSPEEESLTLEEIAQLESENRTAYNNGETLAIYIYFADSPAEDDDEDEGLVTLGAVYRNTSMIIHEATVRSLAAQSPFISITDVETATLNHEFGHLFGLVDLGTDQVNQHEDPNAENHCDVEGCLMRAELQFGGSSNKGILTSSKTKSPIGLKSGCSLSGHSVLNLLEKHAAKGSAVAVPLDAECILDLQANGGR